ncbi:MAG: tetratricopeptide repeat protein [Akkermansiaceae bacterium]
MKNRIVAGKLIVQGKPLPDDLEEQIDIDLLRKDAEEGGSYAAQILERYDNKMAAQELIQLGKSIPNETLEHFDLTMLQADADAGNDNAKQLVNLLSNRALLTSSVQIGKAFNPRAVEYFDFDLLKKDAAAGNLEVRQAIDLIENRKKSEEFCAFGKSFDYDFYKHVDRELLELDADAGYQPATNVLKLANNRLAVMKHGAKTRPFSKDFFSYVDEDMLVKDAVAGNADMQYKWALVNRKGSGIYEHIETEIKYLNLAVNQDHAQAQLVLGYNYEHGIGVPKDILKASELYKKSAEQGDFIAQSNLALFYGKGYGVDHSPKLMIYWMTKSAEAGYTPAKVKLADALFHGHYGVSKNIDAAERWYEQYFIDTAKEDVKAADQYLTNRLSDYHQLIIGKYGRQVGQPKLVELYRSFAEKGHGYSMTEYALRTLRGHGIEQNEEEGLKWLNKAVEANHPVSQEALATLYRNGQHVERNPVKALELYIKAADKGNRLAIRKVITIYRDGDLGNPKDVDLTVKYARIGNDLNDAYSAYNLGICYLNGEGVEKNGDKAIELLRSASAAGHLKSSCYYFLGKAIFYGEAGLKPNPVRGVEYLKKSIDLGSQYSAYCLGVIYLNEGNVIHDITEGLRLLEQAAVKKHIDAMIDLGEIYEKGSHGLERDLPKAVEFYQNAVGLKPRFTTPEDLAKAKENFTRVQALLGQKP